MSGLALVLLGGYILYERNRDNYYNVNYEHDPITAINTRHQYNWTKKLHPRGTEQFNHFPASQLQQMINWHKSTTDTGKHVPLSREEMNRVHILPRHHYTEYNHPRHSFF